ncbi:MAG: hypothetical protein LBH56_05545, partial [Coriobacteriales bacterium]|nr:hypothetical protein [Coriobacteriales bacterium]
MRKRENMLRGAGRRARVLFVLLCSLVFIGALLPTTAFAYYDRGAVGISVGSSSVSIQAGSSISVSVLLNPASDAQTQGCGMAECPQSCPPECMDANGQCICAGTT